jgi:hypothetical protein
MNLALMTHTDWALIALLMGSTITLTAILVRKLWNGLVNGEFEEFEDVAKPDELPTLDPYDIAMTIKKDARLSTQYDTKNYVIEIKVEEGHNGQYKLIEFYAVNNEGKRFDLPEKLWQEVEQYFEWFWFE